MTIENVSTPLWQFSLLGHVARYGMTIPGAAAGDIRPPIETTKAAKRRLSESVKLGLLGHASLYRNRRYHHLMPLGADLIERRTGQEAKALRHGPLSELAKIRAYATLTFCCVSKERRFRLTREDFVCGFPHLYKPGMPMNYYMARGPDRMILGFLRIDASGNGRWDRIVRKLRHDIQWHWLHRGFRELIQNETFEIAVITTTPAKCQRMCRELADNCKLPPVRLRIVAIPELIHLLAPPVIAPAARAQP